VSAGNVIWQSDFAGPVGQGPDIQTRIIEAVLGAVIPSARADTPHRSRVAEGECQDVYDLFLRGKQLQRAGGLERRNTAMELLDEAVRIDPHCGVAWEAIATVAIDWSKEGFAKSGAAARRAIEINDSLAGAWAALAEIAEEEGRWSESERTFLRALYVDPTDATVNAMYAEALLARGRVRDSLHYALEAYRYDPASSIANTKVAFAARYGGEGDLVIKHSKIFAEVRQNTERYGWDGIGEGHIINGDIETAAQIFDARVGTYVADWYPQCVRSLENPSLRDGLAPRLWQTLRQIENGEVSGWQMWYQGWHLARCATWIGEVDLVIEMSSHPETPTEGKFFSFFYFDGAALRQTEYFRNLVIESGLLDYWHEWEFSDYCRPEGDSFACD
jgi:tetratricopeptide (TPR) repeat protein